MSIQKVQKKFSREATPAGIVDNSLMEIEQWERGDKNKDLFEQMLEEEFWIPAHPHLQPCLHHNSQTQSVDDDHPGCKCTKIDCLKLYCECFAKGRLCNKRCICVSCHNHSGEQFEIFKAKQIANYRNPGHFIGVPAYQPEKRCTCKKSSCRKNYCQCFRAGIKCSQLCQCSDCQNGKPHFHGHFNNDFRMECQSMMYEVQVTA